MEKEFNSRRSLGKAGEILAQRFLQGKGYKILEKNFRCRFGEIDLVAKEGGEIVFIEVKSRNGTAFGFPEEQIPWKKRRRLIRLAQFYLKRRRKEEPTRIDVVTLLLHEGGGVQQVELIQNAISLGG
ncbi:MAG: YraN family protein [Candidatus Omnitrophica bacterium]|nr:YraN family protein [Candidatus Omnitrophota bacterium]